MIGKLRTFWSERRYGFATREDNHKDIFIHGDQFEVTSDLPQVGCWLEFNVATRENGREYGININVIPAPTRDGGAS
jgi:cold shock CspA family protein